MPAFDLTLLLALLLGGYVLLTPARQRWTWVLGGLALTSPGLQWLAALFSFPIRLEQSRWAGAVLRMAGAEAAVYGNVIRLNGTDFAVDPACMGVQMTGFSLLAGLFLFIHTENQSRRRLPFWGLMVGCFCLIITALGANFFRILVLVCFGILPDNPLHEVLGIGCWIVYVAVPLQLGVPRLYGVLGRPLEVGSARSRGMVPVLMSLTVAVVLVWLPRAKEVRLKPVRVPGYAVRQLPNGFIQYHRRGVLVYIKPVRTAWSTEHSPYVCWRGSGYRFGAVQETRLNGTPLYRAPLKRDADRLQTGWWFSNGREQTISQVRFRTQMLRGEPAFWLVNVTVENPADWPRVVREWQRISFLEKPADSATRSP